MKQLSVCPDISMGKKAEAGAGEMVLSIECLHASARIQVQFLEPWLERWENLSLGLKSQVPAP